MLLRAEGLVVLAGAGLAYRQLGGPWLLFAALFLAPDLSMAGYLLGPKAGARIYNLGHTYVSPLAVGAAAYFTHEALLLLLCVIWIAHIGFDRSLGYGLKYETAFRDTHLGRV